MKPYIIIFGLRLYFYPIFLYLGIIVAFLLVRFQALKKGWDLKKINLYFWLLVFLSILLSRFIFVAFYIPLKGFKWYFITSLKFWRGGASTVTTIIAAFIISYYMARFLKFDWLAFMDLIAPAAILGQAIQKIGCFFAGCCYGIKTNSFLGVVFNHPDTLAPKGIKVLPAQIFESIGNFLIFILLWRKREKLKFKGELFLLYFISYSVFRFFLEFIRGDSLLFFINQFRINIPQLIALIAFIISLRIYLRKSRLMGNSATTS